MEDKKRYQFQVMNIKYQLEKGLIISACEICKDILEDMEKDGE